jgi:hypothetical protein
MTMLSMNGYETITFPQLYEDKTNFFLIINNSRHVIQIEIHYHLKNNLFYKLRQVCVPLGEYQHNLICDAHNNKIVGHF